MTPDDALRLIDSVTARYQGTRHDHELLATAVHVLRFFVEDHVESDKEVAQA